MVDGKTWPDIIFTEADPPIGGLRTWPQIKTTKPDKSIHITKISDVHNGIRKLLKTKPPKPQTSTTTTYSNILQHARELGADLNIDAHSDTPYRARRDALEVMWGVHVHRCRKKFRPPSSHAQNATHPTNTHILGACRFTAKFRTQRHNNTFKLLHQLLQDTDGGRWPIVGMDLGHIPVTDFKTLPISPSNID